MNSKQWLGMALCCVSTLACSAPLVLNQSSAQTITPQLSIQCGAGGFHADNHYWRAYSLAPLTLPGPVSINAVQFGVEQAKANPAGTTQPVTVNVYTSVGAFPSGVLTLRATQAVNLPNQIAQVVNVPLTVPATSIPADAIVVLELFTPSGLAPVNNTFFIGSNAATQSGPSYLSAAACGVSTPTDVASLGAPNMHMILSASGTSNSLSENLACATATVNALPVQGVLGLAQKDLLLGLLNVASTYQAGVYQSLSLTSVRSAIARTDGCAMRGSPDTVASQGGTGSDFVTNCPAQATIYTCLKDAQTQLSAPVAK